MSGKMKTLGLAILATLAFGAIAAQAATAQDVLTTETEEPVYLQGTQEGGGAENFFTTTWNEDVRISCEQIIGDSTGTVADGSSEIVGRAAFEGCEALGNSATFDTEGCDVVLTGETDEAEDATVSLECEEGKDIRVTAAFGAEITITAEHNQNLSGVSFTNIPGSPDEVTGKVTVHGIHYEANFIAQLAGITATDDDGVLVGAAIVAGFDGANHDNQVDIEVS